MGLRERQSNTEDLPRGFALRCHQQFSTPVDLLSSSSAVGRLVWGGGFDAFVNVLPVTPESVNEEQPLVADEMVLFYEGHVDSREKLGELLNLPDLGLASDGDLLLRAFQVWGSRLQRYVTGEYSFAVVNSSSGCVVAGRDSLGIKPLYYLTRADVLHVSSSLDLLLSGLDFTPSFDLEGLAEYLDEGVLRGKRTIFAGVKLVPPGHTLVRRSSSLSIHAAWRPEFGNEIDRKRPEDYEEQLRALLDEGVGNALRCLVPVCTELSGGLDSSTVTAVAARLVRAKRVPATSIATYSIVFRPEDPASERRYQEAVVHSYGLQNWPFDCTQYPMFGEYAGFVPCEPIAYLSRPIYDGPIREFVQREGMRTLLAGTGGDLLFDGNFGLPVYLCEWIRSRQWEPWLRDVRKYVKAGQYDLPTLALVSLGLSIARPDSPLQWLTPQARERQEDIRRTYLSSGIARSDHPAQALQFAAIERLAYVHPPKLFDWDERHPLMYRPLVEFMLGVPWELKISPEGNRFLQRAALKDILPELVRSRTDKEQSQPALLRGIEHNWWRIKRLASGKYLAELGVADPTRFYRLCERLSRGAPEWFMLPAVNALTFELWCELGGLQRVAQLQDHFRSIREIGLNAGRILTRSPRGRDDRVAVG